MTFEEALKAMRDGHKITRKGNNWYFYMSDGKAYFATQLCDKYEALFDYEGVIAKDWEVVDEH